MAPAPSCRGASSDDLFDTGLAIGLASSLDFGSSCDSFGGDSFSGGGGDFGGGGADSSW